jgi:hypothetical protein
VLLPVRRAFFPELVYAPDICVEAYVPGCDGAAVSGGGAHSYTEYGACDSNNRVRYVRNKGGDNKENDS